MDMHHCCDRNHSQYSGMQFDLNESEEWGIGGFKCPQSLQKTCGQDNATAGPGADTTAQNNWIRT
jgi:hypothetical protein